jgi:1,2-phenylacetyl-CoA epoxidase catalytic subunit
MTQSLPDSKLLEMLESQGYRELVSAHLFAGGVRVAPTIDDKHMLAEHAQEELRHFEVVAALHDKLTGRPLFEIASSRAAEVPTPTTWLEAAVAGYLVDRAASTQLREYTKVGDPRLEAVVREILEHEHEHLAAAETALLDQVRDNPSIAVAMRSHVARWYQIALSLLDGPSGLDADRVAAAFSAGVRGTLAQCGQPAPDGSGAVA